MTARYRLRAVDPHDQHFAREMYAASREADLAVLPLAGDQRDQFIAMQSQAQLNGYQAGFPDARHDAILVGGQVVGRIIVDESPEAIHLVDVVLLAQHRSRGIGTQIITDLQHKARDNGVPLHLDVATTNPSAEALYRRLGFVEQSRHAMYVTMVWVSSELPD